MCREKCEGRHCQETIFTMTEAQIRQNRDAAAFDDRTLAMRTEVINYPRAYTALDLVPHLGEIVVIRQTNHDAEFETTLCAITADGVMLGNRECPEEWESVIFDEFNRMCRFKDISEGNDGKQ